MLQDILEESAVQNYPMGMRLAIDDRVFRYCYSKEALAYRRGAFMEKLLYWEGTHANAIVAAGQKTFTFLNTGVLVGTPIPVHALKDGWIVTANQCQRIRDNEAEVGGECVITLHRGLSVGLTALQTMYVYPNIYANVRNTGGDGTGNANPAVNPCFGAVVCVPLVAVNANRYFWGLTYGIFYGICGLWANNVGLTGNQRVFHFDQLGGMVYRAGAPDVDQYFQPGGYIMMDGNGATAGGDQLCFLQLAP